MKNQLTENIFWNLSLRLELFTSFIPIPTFVYFIAVVGAFKTEEDIRAVALSGLICGTYTVVWGLLYRYFKTKYMLRDLEHLKEGKVSSDKRREKIKLNILHYPYKEGRTIIARWILGATTGLILFGLITGQWFPVIPTLSLYLGLLFVLPICYVMYLFTTENVIRSLLLLPEVVHIRVQKENIYYMGYFMRILLAISAVAIAPITIFGYIIYAIKAGHLSFKDPILHIVLLSFQCITSVVVVVGARMTLGCENHGKANRSFATGVVRASDLLLLRLLLLLLSLMSLLVFIIPPCCNKREQMQLPAASLVNS